MNVAMDANVIAANSKFWACPWEGGGGPVYVSAHDGFGKCEPQSVPLLNGHKAPVSSLGWSNNDLLATGSEDQHVLLWKLDDQGLTASQTVSDAIADLEGHSYAIRSVEWHPLAPILATAAGSGSTEMKIWDVDAQQAITSSSLEAEGVSNMSFNWDGCLMAFASRSAPAKILDPRTGEVVSETPVEPSTRGQRVIWLTNFGANSTLLTVDNAGGARGRRICLWDLKNLSQPLIQTKVDSANGCLFPLYDEGTGTILLSGRGDNTIRVFELGAGCTTISHCSDVSIAGEPMSGIALLPKKCCNVANVETHKILRLSPTTVQPVTFVLPRSEQLKMYFQDDIFPPTRSESYVQTASEWTSGEAAEPARETLRPGVMPLLSEKPPEPKRTSNSELMKAQLDTAKSEDEQRESVMARMQALAVQRSQYHPNTSMGAKTGVDATPIYDSDDGGWSDDDD